MADWLRDAYLELSQKTPLDLKALRPEEPCSNPEDRDWEEDAKKWEAISRDWETLAKISLVQMKAANARIPPYSLVGTTATYNYNTCSRCGRFSYYSSSCMNGDCGISTITAMVDETFRGELESLRENPEHVDHPLPRELLISMFAVSVENNFV